MEIECNPYNFHEHLVARKSNHETNFSFYPFRIHIFFDSPLFFTLLFHDSPLPPFQALNITLPTVYFPLEFVLKCVETVPMLTREWWVKRPVGLIHKKKFLNFLLPNYYWETFEPKRVNSVLNIIGVNSLRLGGLHTILILL